MHVILTITIMHRRLDEVPLPTQSTAEVFHWYKGTSMLNSKLSSPLVPEERDALWVASALLGAIAFSAIEANTPGEAWPLKGDSPDDLHWLKMHGGKGEVLKLVDPIRPDGIFGALRHEAWKFVLPTGPCEMELSKLPSCLRHLCAIDILPSRSENPFVNSAIALGRLQDIECNHDNILMFLSFPGHLQHDCQHLLERKDVRALLLLAHWYRKIQHYHWWASRRAKLEYQAICIYAGRYREVYPHVAEVLDSFMMNAS